MKKGLVVLSLVFGFFTISAIDMGRMLSPDYLAITHSLTATPTPQSPPTTIGNEVPQDLPVITAQNIDQLAVVAQWGRGIPQDIEYSMDGSWLGIASTNGVYLFDPLNIDSEPLFFPITTSLTTLTFNPQGSHFATGRIDGTVEVWDIDKKVRTHLIDYADWDYIYDLALSEEGILIVDSVAFDGIRVYDLESANPDEQIFFAPGFSFAVSPDFERLAVTGEGGRIGNLTVWDMVSQKRVSIEDNPSMAVIYDKDGENLIVGTYHGEIQVWNRDANELDYDFGLLTAEYGTLQPLYCENQRYGPHEPPAPEWQRPNAIQMDYSPTDDLLAVIYENYKGATQPNPIIYDVSTGERLWAFGKEADQLAISSDGNTIASITIDSGEVNLWDAYTGEPIGSLFGFTSNIDGIEFTPDGKAISIKSHGKYDLRLTEDGSLWRTIRSEAFTFSPDGKIVAIGQEDGTVELRHNNDFSLIKTIEAHNAPVLALAFSNEGTNLVSSAKDCTLKLTRISDEESLWLVVYRPSDINDPFTELSFTGNGNFILAKTYFTPYIFSASTGELHIEPDYEHRVIALNPNNDEALYDDLKVFDILQEITTIELDSPEPDGFRADYSSTGALLAAITGHMRIWDQITIWDLNGQENSVIANMTLTSRTSMYSPVHYVTFSPDGTLLVVVGGNSIVYFYGIVE